MNTVNGYNLKIKHEAEALTHQANLAQVDGDVRLEQQLRHAAKDKWSFYYALENKRKKGLDRVIAALEQPLLFDPE
jgi:hypothetical protein